MPKPSKAPEFINRKMQSKNARDKRKQVKAAIALRKAEEARKASTATQTQEVK